MSPKGSWEPRGSPKRRRKEKSSSGKGWKGKETSKSQLLERFCLGWGFANGTSVSSESRRTDQIVIWEPSAVMIQCM